MRYSAPNKIRPTRFHVGPYENLVGQLVFDFPLGQTRAIAIGIPDEPEEVPKVTQLSPEAYIFGYIIHEAFHQYQSEAFGDIPWEREERYPILDRENTALACLEMRLLMDALRKAHVQERAACEQLVGEFVAVRTDRWQRSAWVARYEQGLEIREGSAKYIEVRSLDLASRLQLQSQIPTKEPLYKMLGQQSVPQLLLQNFEKRFTAGSVSPEDMPRNRVYPVAAAQGYLLDVLGIEWKQVAQKAGTDFTYSGLLRDYLSVAPAKQKKLLDEAKSQYSYDQILSATDQQVKAYGDGFRAALATFEAQAGQRVEIKCKPGGVSRSRVASARKWLANSGTRSLCAKFDVYTLKSKDLSLQLTDAGVLELNDWDTHTRTVVWHAAADLQVAIDGSPMNLEEGKPRRFKDLKLTAENGALRYTRPGVVQSSGRRVLVNLVGE